MPPHSQQFLPFLPPLDMEEHEELSQDFKSRLEPLKSIHLFIIQPKVDDYGITITDFFHPNTTHEIMSDKRHILFKGSFKRKISMKLPKKMRKNSKDETTCNNGNGNNGNAPGTKKIHICNLKRAKVATVEFESSSLANEAVVHCPPGTPQCRIIKYGGGRHQQPSYSITSPESDTKELFSIEHSSSTATTTNQNPSLQISSYNTGNGTGNGHSSSSTSTSSGRSSSFSSTSSPSCTIDYSIFKPNNKLIGRVTSKTGLSFMLHITEGVSPMDKALLLGFVIALDMLKQTGKRCRNQNDYACEFSE